MKWLIIGTGWISKSFITALRNNNQVVHGVFSRTLEKGRAFASENGIPNVTTSLKNLGDYDAVYIGTPNAVHYDQAMIVINQQKDLMIEKPMTHSYKLTKELFDLANRKGVKIMEAYAHITNKEFQNLDGKVLKANFMQLSSKIKNKTYEVASSFSKVLFGGVIPDLGVYYISLAVMIFGKVRSFSLKNIEYLNDVIVSCEIELEHEKGFSSSRISKIKDGDNRVYLDGKIVLPKISAIQENRMDAEVGIFISGDVSFYEDISIETARIVELLINSNIKK